MSEPTIGSTDGENFAIDGHTAQHFLAAHISILSARVSIRCADLGCHGDDPIAHLHDARLEAAEAQHHINMAVECAANVNPPHLVVGVLGPLLNEMEIQLDAIRYRAHIPFGDNPTWHGVDLDLSYFPADEDDEPLHESKARSVTIEWSPVEDKREPLALVRQDRDLTGTDWTIVRHDGSPS